MDNGVGSLVSISMENVLNTVFAVPILSDSAWIVIEGTSDLLASDDASVFKDLLVIPTSTTILRLGVDKGDAVVLDLIIVMVADVLDEISVASGDSNV